MDANSELERNRTKVQPEQMSAGRYFATRLTTLKPPLHKLPDPIRLLGMLNRQQWLFFLVGFLGCKVIPGL